MAQEDMAASKEQGRKEPRGLSRPGKLELKKTVETGQIRQSFSHGRSRTVTVEVKRKRTYAAAGEGGALREVSREPSLTMPAPPADATGSSVLVTAGVIASATMPCPRSTSVSTSRSEEWIVSA